MAHISLMDVDRAVVELKQAAKLGLKSVMLTPWPANGKVYGDTYYDPFWATAQKGDIRRRGEIVPCREETAGARG